MRYSNISPNQGNIMRDRFIGIGAGVVVLFASLYFFIINPLLSFYRENPNFFAAADCPAMNSSSSQASSQAIAHTHSVNVNNLTILRNPCGSSPSAARAAGCIFDPTSFVWSHLRCYNADLAAEFLSLRNWSWYADETLSRKLALEEVMTSEYDMVAVTMEYHVHHCLFMWKLLHHQALGPYGKMGVDSYIGNFEHTMHCSGLVHGNDEVLQEFNTKIRIKYPDCGVE